MKLSYKLMTVSVAVLMGLSPIAATSGVVNAAKTTTKKTTSKKADVIVLSHNSYLYFSNGKRNTKYRVGNKTWSVIGKGAKLNAYGTKTINGQLYYFIGNASYIKAANIATVNGKKVSVKKAATTAKKTTTKTIKLTHNAYVYDKNGKRIKSAATLKKNSVIAYIGTKTIKGKKYYNLGKGQYVKTSNAKAAAANTTDTDTKDESTYIKLVGNSVVYDENGTAYSPEVKFSRGAEYKALAAKKIGSKWFYEVGDAPGQSQWIKAVNAYVVSGQPLINDPSYTEPKPSNVVEDTTIITLKGATQTYDSTGAVIPTNTFAAGQSLRVTKLVWIWVASENQAVEFYKTASSSSYIKASDVATISGTALTAENTPEEAQQAATTATATDKASLNAAINNAASVKASASYQAADSNLQAAYDAAITAGQKVNDSSTASVLDVNNALNAITKAQAALPVVSTDNSQTTDTSTQNQY